MAAESKIDKAARMAAEKKNVSRKLDPIHKAILYISTAILALGKFVYGASWLNLQSLDSKGKECLYVPSSFDVHFDDVMVVAAVVCVLSLFTAINFFENR